MKHRLITSMLVFALVGLFSASRAKADNITFTLPDSPTVTTAFANSFTVTGVPFTDNGKSETGGFLEFFGTSAGGGFSIGNLSLGELVNVGGGCPLFPATTPSCQVFSGSTNDPTFDPGTYSFTGLGGTGTLTITSGAGGNDLFSWTTGTPTTPGTPGTPPSGVPEPSSLALLASGGLGLFLKFKNQLS